MVRFIARLLSQSTTRRPCVERSAGPLIVQDRQAWRHRRTFLSSRILAASDAVDQLPVNLRMRNVLRDTSQLFAPGSPIESHTWQQRTDSAIERLATSASHLETSRPIRVGIVGDTLSGTQGLVETLLDDPMMQYGQEEKAQRWLTALRARRQDNLKQANDTAMRIGYGEALIILQEEAEVPSVWLREQAVEFVEIVDPTSVSTSIDTLYTCDKVLIVVDELSLAAHARFGGKLQPGRVLRLLQHFAQKPGTQVVVNQNGQLLVERHILLQGLKEAILDDANNALNERSAAEGKESVVFTSFALAQSANDALRKALRDAGPTAPPAAAWDRFSSLFASSGFHRVREAIESLEKRSNERGRAVAGDKIAIRSSAFVLRRALEQALITLEWDVEYARRAREAVDLLRQDLARERANLHKFLFTASPAEENENGRKAFHSRTGDRSRSAAAANVDAFGIVESTLSTRLPWWKVLWKTDDVRAELETAIVAGFAKGLEQRLMVQTGRLLSIAERLHRRVRALFVQLDNLSTPSDPRDLSVAARNPFASPVLLNELRKYSLETVEAKLDANMLVQPITGRKEQLLRSGGPLDMLSDRAQKNAISTAGVMAPTGMITLLGGLSGSSLFGDAMPSVLHVIAMQPSTAAAAYAFLSIFTLWVSQSRWTRAKRRFWRDWERIAYGLDKDLQAGAVEAFDQNVAVQAIVAVEGLEERAARFTIEVDRTLARIDEIQRQLRREQAS